MAPIASSSNASPSRPQDTNSLVLEGWGQGFMVGSLAVMTVITAANMKSKKVIHKLIIIELLLAAFHGTFIFLHEPAYGWYLSASAVSLNVSAALHNLIAWMKARSFFNIWGSRFYLATLLLAQIYWILEGYANFAFFNYNKPLFITTRYFEPLFRDPWWIIATCLLFYNIKHAYRCTFCDLIRTSPRFGIMIFLLVISLLLTIVDSFDVLGAVHLAIPTGVEPIWKFALVSKYLCDTVILDDFKSTLDRVSAAFFSNLLQSESTHFHPREPHRDAPTRPDCIHVTHEIRTLSESP
ncbi:hypothetical protein AAWM_04680 [Aspergillus awamori]|uniref:Uncharacterized protein n=1 Tax=Aspergillus awamori TaxID=105351 RepID=A0A401KL37_ASPAW|nr:hypothetical protein AAWM_02973 [Aspergillus awamori]GCB21795.1 hypothetical protein AAWM_04680 [Aspergillus awamori]